MWSAASPPIDCGEYSMTKCGPVSRTYAALPAVVGPHQAKVVAARSALSYASRTAASSSLASRPSWSISVSRPICWPVEHRFALLGTVERAIQRERLVLDGTHCGVAFGGECGLAAGQVRDA
jgi:hypothetical protein